MKFAFIITGFMSLPVYPKAICFLWWLMDLVESALSLCLGWVFPENPQKISFNRISWKANAYFSQNMGILFTGWKVRLAKNLLRTARFCAGGGSLITGIVSFAVFHL